MKLNGNSTAKDKAPEDITIDLPKIHARSLWALVKPCWSGGFGDDYDQTRQWLTAKLCQQGGCVHSGEIYLHRENYHITLPRTMWEKIFTMYKDGYRKYSHFHSTREMDDWEAGQVLERYNDAKKPHYKEIEVLLLDGLQCCG